MEIETIVSFASEISTPLILAGVVVGVLWGVFKLVIKKSPVWAKKDSLPIIIKIVNWIGVLALVSIILGFVGFFITETGFTIDIVNDKQAAETSGQVSDESEYYKYISDETIRKRIMAHLHDKNVIDAMNLVKHLKDADSKSEELKHILDYCAKNSGLDGRIKNSCKSISRLQL